MTINQPSERGTMLAARRRVGEVEIVAHAGTLATGDKRIGSCDVHANESALDKDTRRLAFIGEFDVKREGLSMMQSMSFTRGRPGHVQR